MTEKYLDRHEINWEKIEPIRAGFSPKKNILKIGKETDEFWNYFRKILENQFPFSCN